jgi:hypothetical protein
LADHVASLTVNGQPARWHNVSGAVGRPAIAIVSAPAGRCVVEIQWQGESPEQADPAASAVGSGFSLKFAHARPGQVLDPEHALTRMATTSNRFLASPVDQNGSHTAFLRLTQGDLAWWEPLQVDALRPDAPVTPAVDIKNWQPVDLTRYFNDRVTQIFQNNYFSPRAETATLELPTQGIGNWCYPLTQANIDDSGLRRAAGTKNEIRLPTGAPLRTPSGAGAKNILFVSQWDNYPRQATLPLRGQASRAVLLMAGSTSAMQSQFVNGEIVVAYADGTTATLPLRNPETWWPIEQDYVDDGFAFQLRAPKPYRVHLKTGLITKDFNQYTTIKGFSTKAIDGGAATVLELPLDPAKKLKSLTVRALANDVVIGLMSVTLGRD